MRYLIATLLLIANPAFADDAAQRLQAALSNMDNLTTEFKQTQLDEDKNIVQQSRGTLALQRRVSGHDRAASGPVRITFPESMLELLLPLLGGFRTRHPRIEPILETGDRMFDLQRREADVRRVAATTAGRTERVRRARDRHSHDRS